MQSVILYLGGLVVVLAITLLATFNPILAVAIVAALATAYLLILAPRQRVVGYSAVAVLALMMLVPIQNIGDYGGLRFGVLGATVFVAALGIARRVTSLGGRPTGLFLFGTYFALLALSTSLHPDISNPNLFLGVFISGAAPVLLFTMCNSQERGFALRGLIVIAGLEAVYSITEFALRLSPLWGASGTTSNVSQIFSGQIRAQGTLGHPLPLALLLLVALALNFQNLGASSPTARMLTSVLLLGGILATGSRSAALVAVALMLISIGRTRWHGFVIGGYAGLTLGVALGAFGFFSSDLVTNFINGDSVGHRSDALGTLPGLVSNQAILNVVLGNGYFSAPALFEAGLLQAGNFFAVDNQFVTTLVEGGLVTLAVLIALIARALTIGSAGRMGLLTIVFYFATFDVLLWPSGMALFGAMLGLSFARKLSSVSEVSSVEATVHEDSAMLNGPPQRESFRATRRGTERSEVDH